MAYRLLRIPLGVSRRNSEAQAGMDGRYWDSNLVRSRGELIVPVGGWVARSANAVTGTGRAILAWEANNGGQHIVVGTNEGLTTQTTSGTNADITPLGFIAGNADSGSSTGFGGGAFGTGAFGTPRPDVGITTEAAVWDLDTFGEYLVGVCNSDGVPYYWTLDPDTPAVPIPGAPIQASGIAVTSQRSVMIAGPNGDGRAVQWCDLEDFTDWTPTSENQAGSFDITTKGAIRKIIRVNDVMLILTSVDAWLATYSGPPFIYGFQPVGHGCGVLSKGAAVNMGQTVVWWSDSGFWQFDGTACTPIPCEVDDLIKTGVNLGQIAKISGFHNTEFGEVWWDYPSTDSTENDSYIAWNYRTGEWWIGSRVRLCSCEKGPFRWPMSVGVDGLIYTHERGHDFEGAVPYAETGPLMAGIGDQVIAYNGIIGDERTVGETTISFTYKDHPNSTEYSTNGVSLAASGYTDLRFAGRQAKLRITGVALKDWAFGAPTLDIEIDGRR